MTDALRAHGFHADVSDVSFGPIGTGQMADSFRFRLTYSESSESDPAPPSSVVLKMHAEDPLSREAGRGGAYGSEVRFYTKLAPTCPSVRRPVSTPPSPTSRIASRSCSTIPRRRNRATSSKAAASNRRERP